MACGWKEQLAGAAVLAALAAVGCCRLPLGFDLSDECCYAVAAQRHALGDVPFRDTADGSLAMYDVALWPVFALRPDVTLLELRGVGLALLTAAYAALWLLLSRHMRPLPAALACAAGFFALSNWFWAPGYNAMFFTLTLAAVSMWLLAAEQPRPARCAATAFAAGVVWAIACACYLPMSIATLPALAACAYGLATRRMQQPFCLSAAWLVAGMAATAIAALTTLAWFDLLGPWWDGLRQIGASQMEYLSADRRAIGLLRAMVQSLGLPMIAIALAAAIVAFAARRQARAAPVALAVGLAVGMIAAVGLLLAQRSASASDFLVCGWLVCLAAVLHLRALAGIRLASQAEEPDAAWRRAYCVLLAVAAIGFAGQGFFSDTRLHSALAWTGPLLTLGLAAAFRRAARSSTHAGRVGTAHRTHSREAGRVGTAHGMHAREAGRVGTAHGMHSREALASRQPIGGQCPPYGIFDVARNARGALAALCVGCCVLAAYAQFAHVYREAPLGELTAEFAHPRLRGLRSTPERVAVVDAVAEFLNERLQPGETLLVGHSSCVGLYYLTGTRPALSAAWLSERLHPDHYQRLVAEMVAADRAPRYYVGAAQHTARLGNPVCPPVPSTVLAGGTGPNAVLAYVQAHYEPVRTIYPFEIWRRSDEPSAVARNETRSVR